MKTNTSNLWPGYLLAAAVWLNAALLVVPVNAANECQVKYAYSGSVTTVDLDAGETKNINKSNVLYVQNLKSTKVRVYRSGFGEFVDLMQNGRDPGLGNYGGGVTLQKLQCFATAASTPQTAAAMIGALQAAGGSVNDIAEAVVDAFNVGGAELASLLKAAGYDASQTAGALQSAVNASAAQVASFMKGAGYSVAQVAASLAGQLNLAGSQVAQTLEDAGYTAAEIGAALKGQFNAGAGQIAQWLRQAGFAASEVASVLAEEFAHNANLMASWLKEAGYASAEIAEVLKNQYNLSQEQAAQIMKNLSLSAVDVAMALHDTFYSTAQQAANVLTALYDLAGQALRNALQAAGYTAAQIEAALTPPVEVGGVISLNNYYGPRSSNGPVVPLYINAVPLDYEVRGSGLTAITSVTRLPLGATGEVGFKDGSRLRLNIFVPETAQIGKTGTADLFAGGTKVGEFEWMVQAMPRAGERNTGEVGRSPAPARTLPDLAPTTFVNSLYRVGSATTMDAAGDTFTALDPFNNSPFCQGIPVGQVNRDNSLTSNRSDVRVPDIRWGVRNPSTTDITTPFTVKLLHGGQEVASQQVNSLPAGDQIEFQYARPQSVTTVAKVGPANGCYHAGLQRDGWNDNAGYQVRVDSGNQVEEANENNNTGSN